MHEVLLLETPHWELSIHCRNVEARAKDLALTLHNRGKELPSSVIRFSPSIEITSLDFKQDRVLIGSNSKTPSVDLPSSLFFENTEYSFEITFNDGLLDKAPEVIHKLKLVNDAFYYRKQRLSATINFSNHIGWFRLPFEYFVEGQKHSVALSFEVLPTKMDLKSDLDKINQLIDSTYPLWRFSLAEKTEQEYQRSRNNGPSFLLLWFAQFESLQNDFNQGFKQIINAPHNRLIASIKHVKADKLKGKLNAKLSEKVKTDIQNKVLHKRYQVEQKVLSLDTPENQFIKMVLLQAQSKLTLFRQIALENEKSPEKQRLSDAFYSKLDNWKKGLDKYSVNPLFKEIGRFSGLKKESLVLQQKAGYSKVYGVWQQLKLYLDVLGNQSSISMKSVADLYEIWCFLEIRRLLISSLGFREKNNQKAILTGNLLEKKTQDGLGAAFHFNRDDGISIRLAHEPRFNKGGNPIRSWLLEHKPDIVLEASFKSGEKLIWVFDAKYRIKTKKEEGDDSQPVDDLVPNDAINQMHRYRDALIYLDDKDEGLNTQKSRPVFGAFALYPGYFTQSEANKLNPYDEAIREINIGAFPLLPSDDGSGSIWLEEFLKDKLGLQYKYPEHQASTDRYYIEDSARIPYYGMKQTRFDDLTLFVTSAQNLRAEGYYEQFNDGSANWFHIPLSTFERENMKSHAINELRYCIVATPNAQGIRVASHIWVVESVKICSRDELTLDQSGVDVIDSKKKYWLLKFGEAKPLDRLMTAPSDEHHHMGFIEAKNLKHKQSFNELSEYLVYRDVATI